LSSLFTLSNAASVAITAPDLLTEDKGERLLMVPDIEDLILFRLTKREG